MVKSRDNELIVWYDAIIDAVGRNDEDDLDKLKVEMARSFYPQQLRNATKDLEEQREKLEEQIEEMKNEAREYGKKIKEIEKERTKLQEKEEELEKREEETKELRKNAKEDAINAAQKLFDKKKRELQKEYQEKEEDLERREEETKTLRENAQRDAIDEANKKIEEERRKLQEQYEEKVKKINEEIQQQIDMANEQIQQANMDVDKKITDYNFIKAKKRELEELLQEKENELIKIKKRLEELLGRQVVETDFIDIAEDEKQLTINDNKSFVVQDDEDGEIQKIHTDNERSVFDYSNGQNWSMIGEIVLEKNCDRSKFAFNSECAEKMGKMLTNEKMKKQKSVICDDGIVLYQGEHNRTIAVRIIEQEGNKYKNLYRFYSNTMVTPIQAFKSIVNLVLNVNACGTNIVTNDIIDMKLKCLIYSNKNHLNSKICKFEQLEEGLYYVEYENKTQRVPKIIAKSLIEEDGLNCSTAGITDEELEIVEKKTFIKHSEIMNEEKMEIIEKIKKISNRKIDLGQER